MTCNGAKIYSKHCSHRNEPPCRSSLFLRLSYVRGGQNLKFRPPGIKLAIGCRIHDLGNFLSPTPGIREPPPDAQPEVLDPFSGIVFVVPPEVLDLVDEAELWEVVYEFLDER